MMKYLIAVAAVILLASCAKRPTSAEMVSNFEENKATFAMIASLACDIGKHQNSQRYTIRGGSESEDALLDLADTVDVEQIVYVAGEKKCVLDMPVWESDEAMPEQLSYRYNLVEQENVFLNRDKFEHAFSELQNKAGKIKHAHLKLTKRWAFSAFKHAS